MDLWATLGVSPEVGIVLAVVGVVTAFVGATLLVRRSRAGDKTGFDLGSPR
jgi:hypothetical protein